MKWFAASLLSVFVFFLSPMLQAVGQSQVQSDVPSLQTQITKDSVAAVVVHPKALLELETMKLFPHEVLEAYGKEQLGINIKQAVEATLVAEAPQRNAPPMFGLIVRFDQPQTFAGTFKDAMREEKLGDHVYHMFGSPTQPMAISFRGDRTMYVGNAETIASFDNRQSAAGGPLQNVIDKYPADKLFQIYMAIEPVRALMVDNLPPADQVPPPFQGWLDAPELSDYLYVDVDLSDNFRITSRVGAVDEKAAQQLRRLQAQSMQMGKAGAMMELAKALDAHSPAMQNAVNTYADRVLNYLDEVSQPEVVGNELVYIVKPNSGSFQVATIGILTGMLLPAVQQVRFASRRVQSTNNLKQLALAFHNYASAYGRFPPHAIYSIDGKPLLSWRVAILPFLDQQLLYEKFHLDEPWDSPHNIELVDQMPQLFISPNAGDLGGKTVYQCFSGKDTLFPPGPEQKVSFRNVVDGTSNTIMFVEADPETAVQWSKPADLDFDPAVNVTGVGNLLPESFIAAIADGSVITLSSDLPQETLKNLIMINDGNVVSFDR